MADYANRVVLMNVPPVGFYGAWKDHPLAVPAPEDVCLAGCLASCLNFLGEGMGRYEFFMALPGGHPMYPGGRGVVDLTYAFLMGTTGAGFRLNWKPGWHGDNVATWLVSDDPSEVFRRAFASVGRELTIAGKCQGDSEKTFRSAVVESINRSVPVIAHGVIGPPEECVITGYDEGGEVLIGYSYFQRFPEFNAGVEFEPTGEFRKRDWLKDTWSLCVIGKKVERPPLAEVYRDALCWILEVMRTPVRHGDRANGIAAFNAWREHVLRDEEFPVDDPTVLRERFNVACDASDVIAEGRWYAHVFCRIAAEKIPSMKEPLYAAAACFDAEHTLMWKLWRTFGGPSRSGDSVRRFADSNVRRHVAEIIIEARNLDAKAADHIERAIKM